MKFERHAFYRGEVYDILTDSWEIADSTKGIYPDEDFCQVVILYTDECCFNDTDILTVLLLHKNYHNGDVLLNQIGACLEDYYIRPSEIIEIYKSSIGDLSSIMTPSLIDHLEEQMRNSLGVAWLPVEAEDEYEYLEEQNYGSEQD